MSALAARSAARRVIGPAGLSVLLGACVVESLPSDPGPNQNADPASTLAPLSRTTAPRVRTSTDATTPMVRAVFAPIALRKNEPAEATISCHARDDRPAATVKATGAAHEPPGAATAPPSATKYTRVIGLTAVRPTKRTYAARAEVRPTSEAATGFLRPCFNCMTPTAM